MKSLMIAALVAASVPAAAIAQDAVENEQAPAVAAEAPEAAPQVAQEAAPAAAPAEDISEQLKPGRTVRDTNSLRLGKIDRVTEDGSVRLIFSSRFVTIPGDTLSVKDGDIVTSLTKREVAKLR